VRKAWGPPLTSRCRHFQGISSFSSSAIDTGLMSLMVAMVSLAVKLTDGLGCRGAGFDIGGVGCGVGGGTVDGDAGVGSGSPSSPGYFHPIISR
jgi:hypothetical protein